MLMTEAKGANDAARKRARYGSGSLRQLGPDSFSLRVWDKVDASGRRRQIQKRFRGTPVEARKQLRELIRQVERDEYVEPSKMTLRDYLNTRWLPAKAAVVRPLTLQTVRGYIGWYIEPFLGGLPISKITRERVQDLYGRLQETGGRSGRSLSARTVVKVHSILRASLADAVKWEYLVRNPADLAEPPRPDRVETKVLDPAQVTQILDELQRSAPWVHPVVLLAFHTGARRSELLGLTWADVDLSIRPHGAISIRRGYHRLDDGRSDVRAPKTAKGSRWIPLTRTAHRVLAEQRELAIRAADEDGRPMSLETPVFADPVTGEPFRPDSVTQAFRRACARIGLRGVRFHDTRHVHASLLLKTGVHVKVVSERLGHASTLVTLDTYSHVMPGLQEAATESLENVLGSGRALSADAVASGRIAKIR